MEGCRAFSDWIDPRGLTAAATGRRLTLSPGTDGGVSWTLTLVFSGNDGLRISGITGSEGPLIETVRMPQKGGWKEIPVKPSPGLSEALSPLDRVPIRLKRILAPKGPETAGETKVAAVSPERYLETAMDALLWEVEGGQKAKAMFKRLTVKTETGGVTCMTATACLRHGEILIECDADEFGLSRKRVTLRKSLGMSRETRAECVHLTDGKAVPSLSVALDLYEAIPRIYSGERNKGNRMGRPSATAGK